MRKLVLLFLLFVLVACEPTETEEIVTVSDTPYIKTIYIGNDGDGNVLVPEGCAMATNDVEIITFEYQLEPYSSEIIEGFIRIEALDILIDGSDEYADLVVITIMDTRGMKLIPILNETMTITITVELLEPIDQAEALSRDLDISVVNVENAVIAHDAIIGKPISFEIQFLLIES